VNLLSKSLRILRILTLANAVIHTNALPLRQHLGLLLHLVLHLVLLLRLALRLVQDLNQNLSLRLNLVLLSSLGKVGHLLPSKFHLVLLLDNLWANSNFHPLATAVALLTTLVPLVTRPFVVALIATLVS